MGAGNCCCWECLILRDITPFSGPSCLSPCAEWAFCSWFFYLSLFTSISASVVNLPYPFNDLFLQYPQFMRQESLHEQSSIVLWTGGQAVSPKASKDCHECFPSLCLNVSRARPHFFVGRALWLVPSPVLWGRWLFLLFACSEQKRSIFSEKPCSKNNFRALNSKKPLQKCWA